MLYTASYLSPAHHHGRLLSVSTNIPSDFKLDGKLEFLIPNTDNRLDCPGEQISFAEYTEQYREQIKNSWQEVKSWLDHLDPKQHSTLLCGKCAGRFCHRYLVAKLVQKYRPDCYGGCDAIRVLKPKCRQCGQDMIPGLDASFCRGCKTWFKNFY